MRPVGGAGDDQLGRVAGAEALATLEDVLAWYRLRAGEIVDVIVQDEYTHDVVVRAGDTAYLCFDTT